MFGNFGWMTSRWTRRRSRRRTKTWTCERLRTPVRVSARQERIRGWDQEKLSGATGLLIGAGGLMGEVGEGQVRKGIGTLHVADFDIVTPSNLNRQKFLKRSLYKSKALELCRLLSKHGYLGTRLIAHSCSFQELSKQGLHPDFVVCGVDNQLPETRLAVCRWCHERRIPGVFIAVSTDADYGYVMVQAPGSACWACVLKPDLVRPRTEDKQCPGVPASVDIPKALGGIACYAVDSLVMSRPRDWNYRVISLSCGEFGSAQYVPPRPDCPVCRTMLPNACVDNAEPQGSATVKKERSVG